MSTKPKNELSPKHLQALDLIRTGLKYREVAKQIGWSEDHLQKLIAGDSMICGSSAVLFSEEVKKIRGEEDKLTKEDARTTRQVIMAKWREFALEWKDKKPTPEAYTYMLKIMETMSKSTPKVEIGSFSYTSGLSLEDIQNEYRRARGVLSQLRGIKFAAERGSVQDAPSSEPGDPSS